MYSISNLKPLVQSKTLVQTNSQPVLIADAFNYITVSTTQAGGPSGGSNGDYSINTSTNALSYKSSGSWATVSSGSYYLITCETNSTFDGKFYLSGSSGVLAVPTTGRYLPTNSSKPYVYDVPSSGIYSTNVYTNGQTVVSTNKCYCLIAGTWAELN
jgi:hypothetical protein